MLRGYIDSVCSSGHVLGWAYDARVPLTPIPVSIIGADDREIAWGSANGYRDDLAAAGHSAGWCAFRLKIDAAQSPRRCQVLTLADRRTYARISRRSAVPYVREREMRIRSLDQLADTDPSVIRSLDQLKGCDPVFAQFLAARGAEEFVRTAYVYLLGRTADKPGLKAYRNFLQSTGISPFALLKAIADSEEYRSRPRRHASPTMPGFPFRLAASC
jgi:hypothetical protein